MQADITLVLRQLQYDLFVCRVKANTEPSEETFMAKQAKILLPVLHEAYGSLPFKRGDLKLDSDKRTGILSAGRPK